MPVLTDPTLAQLRRIKEQNLETIFADVAPVPPEQGAVSRILSVGIGPRTQGAGDTVELETTGANTVVLLVHPFFEPPFAPSLLTGLDEDGTEISVIPSFVPTGVFQTRPAGAARQVTPTITLGWDLDIEKEEPAPGTARARLLINDRRNRSYLMAGVYIGVAYDLFKASQLGPGVPPPPTCDAPFGPWGFSGTLGCIARTTDLNRLVGLTCHHVVLGPDTLIAGTAAREADYRLSQRGKKFVLQVSDVGAEQYSDAPTKRLWGLTNGMRSDDFVVGQATPGNCCGIDRDTVARLHRSRYTGEADAAAILLEDSQTQSCLFPLAVWPDLTDWRAEMLGPGGSDAEAETFNITGALPGEIPLGDLQQPAGASHRLSYVVRKYGRTTGLTTGLVRCIEVTDNPNRATERQTPPTNPGDPCTTITLPVGKNRIWVIPYNQTTSQVGEVFAVGGDSGAAVINAAGQVIGLVTDGVSFEDTKVSNQFVFDQIRDGWGASLCRISSIVAALKVQIEPFNAANRIRTVPDGNSVVPFFRGVHSVPEHIRKSAATSTQLALARRMFPRVSRLVNHNRRVLTAWHRSKGPQLANGLLRALADPVERVPSVVDGQASTVLIRGFLDVLRDECSDAELGIVAALTPTLLALPGMTATEVLQMLGEPPCPPSS